MTDLVAWLRTQLDADEQAARLASGVVEMFIAPRQNGKTVVSAFMRINTPDRALCQVQAHRTILDDHVRVLLHKGGGADYFVTAWVCRRCGGSDASFPDGTPVMRAAAYPCLTIRSLASIYSDRDGYRTEWSHE